MPFGHIAYLGLIGVVALLMRASTALLPLDALPWPDGLFNDRTEGYEYATIAVPNEPYILVVGGSSSQHGFDFNRLGARAHSQAYSRGYASEIAYSLSWTLRNNLRDAHKPSLIVWPVNRGSFIKPLVKRPLPCVGMMRLARPSPSLDRRLGTCDGATWDSIDTRARYLLAEFDPWFGARGALADLIANRTRSALGLAAVQGSHEGLSQFVGQDAAEKLHKNIADWGKQGTFTHPGFLPAHKKAGEAIRDMAKRASIPLLLVSMPEHSATRKQYTPEVRREWDSYLATLSDHVVDLWSAVSDDGFYDQAHLNERGRAQTTNQIRPMIEAAMRGGLK